MLGTAIAAGRAIAAGSQPGSWAIAEIAAPLVVGWVLLAVVAWARHILPAVGPGDQVAHAVQRRVLGVGSTARLVAVDVGALALAIALPTRTTRLRWRAGWRSGSGSAGPRS